MSTKPIHCQKCKTTEAKSFVKNSTKTTKKGKINISYMCNVCTNERTKNYYHRNKEKVRAIIYKSIAKHWEKQVARMKLNDCVKRGKIKRPEVCSKCKEQGRIEGHHEDYTKPLEVVWLCTGCHAEADKSLV